MKTTIDGTGRLVIPKEIRLQAGFRPGETLEVTFRDGRVEIEPAPREVRIEERDGLRVAEPVGGHESLKSETVRRTRDGVRSGRKPG